MTLIDWMMEHPYLAAVLIFYALTVIVTTKATITISIGGRKGKDREGGW